MRRYLNLFVMIVTLALLGGCAGGGKAPVRTVALPTDDRLPQFQPLTGNRTADNAAPLPTATGRAAVTPYYKTEADRAQAQIPIKIGFLVPLSGPQAALGQGMLNAAQLALFDVGAGNITLVPRDTTTGATAAARDVLNEGVQIILGPLFAPDVRAVSPIAAANHVPVIAFSTDWTAATDNTYIMGFTPFGQVARVVDYAAHHGARNFASLAPQTPYGQAVGATLRNELQRQNLTPPFSYSFGGAANLNGAAQSLSANPEVNALLLPVGGAELTSVSTALRQNDINVGHMHVLGTGLWDDSPQAASQVPGAWFAAPDPKLRVGFNAKYRDTYGAAPPRLASLAYDATALSAALAVKGLTTGGKPAYTRNDFTKPGGFSGIDGVFRFRNDGLAERGLAVLELRPGGAAVIDPAPTRF